MFTDVRVACETLVDTNRLPLASVAVLTTIRIRLVENVAYQSRPITAMRVMTRAAVFHFLRIVWMFLAD